MASRTHVQAERRVVPFTTRHRRHRPSTMATTAAPAAQRADRTMPTVKTGRPKARTILAHSTRPKPSRRRWPSRRGSRARRGRYRRGARRGAAATSQRTPLPPSRPAIQRRGGVRPRCPLSAAALGSVAGGNVGRASCGSARSPAAARRVDVVAELRFPRHLPSADSISTAGCSRAAGLAPLPEPAMAWKTAPAPASYLRRGSSRPAGGSVRPTSFTRAASNPPPTYWAWALVTATARWACAWSIRSCRGQEFEEGVPTDQATVVIVAAQLDQHRNCPARVATRVACRRRHSGSPPAAGRRPPGRPQPVQAGG